MNHYQLTKKRAETFNGIASPISSLTTNSNAATTIPITKFQTQIIHKVVVPELSSPVSSLNLEASFEKASNVDNCPDGNVLRKVASLTAEQFNIKSSSGSNVNQQSSNETKLVCKHLLANCRFDLKSFVQFEGNILVNWLCKALAPYFDQTTDLSNDLIKWQRIISIEFCNFLLMNGIIRYDQPDDVNHDSNYFKVYLILIFILV